MNALINEQELDLATLASVLQSDSKQDFAVPADKIHTHFSGDNNERTTMLFGLPETSQAPRFAEDMTGYATDQFHARLAPGLKSFAEHLREQNMASTYQNTVRDVLQNDGRTFRIRTLKNDNLENRMVRAVVSDRYKPIDDDIIFGTALPLIDPERFQGIGGNKTDIRTVSKFIERDPSVVLKSGGRTREFHMGFILNNSEVGAGSASFSMFMSDSWCSNGCIFSKEVLANISYKHIGSQIDVRHGLIENSQIEQAELLSIKRAIQDATNAAMSIKGREKITAALEASLNRTIQTDVTEFFDDLGAAIKLTKDEVKELPLHMQNDEMNQLGVQAAITALAKTKNYERRLQLETLGGNVLMMDDRAWNRMAA